MRRLVLLVALGCACGPPAAAPWVWSLPPNFPAPAVPDDNPMSAAKVALGRRLFFDAQLSANQQQSCASCHDPARAYTDGRVTAVGSTGQAHRRNAQSLVNVAYAPALTWANPLIPSLEQQALLPIFGDKPVELGWLGHGDQLLARLAGDADYAQRFTAVFGQDGLTLSTLTRALAAFERTLISGGSPWDRYVAGDATAVSDAAKRGNALFTSEVFECYHCHGGFSFTDTVFHAGTTNPEKFFHNTGLYDLDHQGSYPLADQGEVEITNHASDMGRFRAPSLRNLRFTGPYLHDGSATSLGDLIDTYAAGGRVTQHSGRPSPLQSELVRPFTMTAEQKADLLAFLDALNDDDFVAAQQR
jgi:cytochrome c peroxidase